MDYSFWNIAPIILFPLGAFVINAFVGCKLYRKGDFISVGAIFASFLYALRIFKDVIVDQHSKDFYVHKVFTWFDLSVGDFPFKIDMGFYIDSMTATMLLMVTGVATLIHLFSTFYMAGDAKYGKFFVFLSLFTSAMLALVLSDNLLSIFIFWELMGFCSYSLIGFYVEKEAAGNASIKAFMTTRVGDVLFLLGILAIYNIVGSISIVDIYSALAMGSFEGQSVIGVSALTFIAVCLFGGTIGKSAQFPLQVWLPDAMMGPTPCSALIHAATMVAAGVYLSLRMYPVMVAGGITDFIALIGVITAFGAATIALIQTDIKAVLAFSTISQLGYMVMGIGVGAYNPSFMHLITHAVFKACLFLAAGSVIHSLHDHHTHGHVQEMPRMGGLRKKMPYTFLAMLCCTLAISGVPLFSGFVSKDRILGDALYFGMVHPHKWMMIVPVLGFITAGLTAFYMFRMLFLTFFGAPRDEEVYNHCHKEHFSFTQNFPLLLLSLFTLGVVYSGSLTGLGKINIPVVGKEWFSTLITMPKVEDFTQREKVKMMDSHLPEKFETSHYHVHEASEMTHEEHVLHKAHSIGAITSIIIAFLGIFFAYLMYISKGLNPAKWESAFSCWNKALKERYYFDHFYEKILIGKGLHGFNNALAWFDLNVYDRYVIDGWEIIAKKIYLGLSWFDMKIVDAIVDLSGTIIRFFNVTLRTMQTGRIQFYFVVLFLALSGYMLLTRI